MIPFLKVLEEAREEVLDEEKALRFSFFMCVSLMLTGLLWLRVYILSAAYITKTKIWSSYGPLVFFKGFFFFLLALLFLKKREHMFTKMY